MKTKAILLGTLVMAILAACSNDESEHIANGSKNAPTFTASIDGLVNTRAYNQVWENNDAIGITGTSGNKQYTNVKHITTGNGNFDVADAAQTIYYQDDNNVSFTAYYPWSESTTITAGTEKQKEQSTFDFLYGTGTGSKASPNVALAFTHKMAKVVLTIKKGADVGFDEVKAAKLSLEGFLHKGTFNGLTGEVTATEGAVSGWCFAGNAEAAADNDAPKTENTADETVSYTLILFPQTFAAKLPFSATLEGKQTFKADLDFTTANSKDENPGNYWIGGRQYNMSITLNKTGITVNGCTIQKWDETNGGDVSAQ